jgi:uncharacterized damage-inducible protein DinB
MNVTEQMGKHMRAVYLGGNWTDVHLKKVLADVTWQEATTQVDSCNTIATLVFHMNYFIHVVIKVLEGGPLEGNDKLSFDHPPINSSEDWEQFLEQSWEAVDTFANLIAKMPEDTLWENIGDEKYGNFYFNLHGIIEHTHYHLGQIVLVKKLLKQTSAKAV